MKRSFLFLILWGVTQMFSAMLFAQEAPTLETFVGKIVHRLIEHNHLAPAETTESVEEQMAFQERLGQEASVLVMLLVQVNGSYVKSQVEDHRDAFGKNLVFIEGFVDGTLQEGGAYYSADIFEGLRQDVHYKDVIGRLFFDTIWPAPSVVMGTPDVVFEGREHLRLAGPMEVPAQKNEKAEGVISEPTVETRPTLMPPLKPNK